MTINIAIDDEYKKVIQSETNNVEIHYAIRKNDLQKLKGLIEKGINIEQPGENKLTPLQLAIELGFTEIVKTLIYSGADVNNTVNDCSPLEIAASYGQIEIVKFLIESGANINSQDLSEWTPLMTVVAAGFDDVARLLIDAGADINIVNDDNHTVLNIAIRENRWKIVEYLLPLLSPDERKYAEEQFQCRRRHQGKRLLYAVSKGQTHVVKKNLKTEINIEDIGAALILASSQGYKDIVNFLLQTNIDINFCDRHKCNALMYAAKFGQLEIVSILLQAGANVNLKNKEGYTAINYAEEFGHTAIKNKLLTIKTNNDE